jgi:hypothetical protein
MGNWINAAGVLVDAAGIVIPMIEGRDLGDFDILNALEFVPSNLHLFTPTNDPP